jgi:hypothetical protein
LKKLRADLTRVTLDIIQCRIVCITALIYKTIKIKKCRNIKLHFVVFGCESWALSLREFRRLSVCENGVLGRILRAKKKEVTVQWGKQHSEELSDLYLSPIIVRGINPR